MNIYTSVFQHPTKGIHRYGFNCRSLKEEVEVARDLDGHEAFGELLYCRQVMQAPIRVGERYQFQVSQETGRLKYRHADEQLFGQFDYFTTRGPHHDQVTFIVEKEVVIPELNTTSLAILGLAFNAVHAGKFKDLCKAHLFAIEMKDGEAALIGYRTQWDADPSVKIPLELAEGTFTCSTTSERWLASAASPQKHSTRSPS